MRGLAGIAVVIVAGCYHPDAALGVPCAANGACPGQQLCDTSVEPPTCVSMLHDAAPPADGPLVDAPVVSPDAMADAAPDAAPAPITLTTLGQGETEVSGTSVTLTVTQDVPAGSLVVVQVAGRGMLPVTMTDARGNTWATAVAEMNQFGSTVAGIYTATLTQPLVTGDAITATLSGSASTRHRAILATLVANASALDQIGSGQTMTTTPSITTAAAVAAPAEAMFGVIATGYPLADTITPGGGFAQVLGYSTAYASGSLDALNATSASGVVTYGATTTEGTNASYAQVIATFR